MTINVPTSGAFFRWRPACWLRVTGEDAATFLQGQFTNDLRGLPRGGAVYGLWLTLKGKVLADSFILPGGEGNEFWIGSYDSSATIIHERLENHVIADDVLIEDATLDWAGISVLGEAAVKRLSIPTEGGAWAFAGRRDSGPNVEWVYPIAAGEPEWLATLGAAEVDTDEMARRRIRAGIPAIPTELGPADLPNEAGLESVAISYTKGCYLGQEVMARLKSMGQVRRRLWRVCGEGVTWPPLPAPVFAGARQVGELRSAVRDGPGFIGFAMVSLIHAGPGAELSFASEGAPALRLNPSP